MKKLLNTMLLAAGLALVAVPFANADTSQNASTETAGQYTSASMVTAEVKSKLLAKKNIDSTKINVQSETAANKEVIVILSGTQKTQKQIDIAEATTRSVKGVVKVVNKLKVEGQ